MNLKTKRSGALRSPNFPSTTLSAATSAVSLAEFSCGRRICLHRVVVTVDDGDAGDTAQEVGS